MENELKSLFDKQIIFQTRLENLPFKNIKDQQNFININILACLDELSEVLRETAWKNPKYIKGGWKINQELNEDKFKEEIIDLWHFVINLSLAADFTSEELYDMFEDKNKINHKRHNDGY
jgi:dimeric dUTPase (all-alpha-NTP-PPase superfamily)